MQWKQQHTPEPFGRKTYHTQSETEETGLYIWKTNGDWIDRKDKHTMEIICTVCIIYLLMATFVWILSSSLCLGSITIGINKWWDEHDLTVLLIATGLLCMGIFINLVTLIVDKLWNYYLNLLIGYVLMKQT